MFVNVTWRLNIGVLSEHLIHLIERMKESVSLSDRILLSLNSGIWVIRNNVASCEAQSESWWHNSKNGQNWLMPNLRVWVTMKLTKNTWLIPVACKNLFSFYIQNKSELPQCRHDAALKVFTWRYWLISGSDVRVHWQHPLSFHLASGWIWQLRCVFSPCCIAWAFLECIWSEGRRLPFFW